MFSSQASDSPLARRILRGAISGFVATAPMTASMIIGWRLLPAREKYPLPPQQITGKIADQLNVDLSEPERDAVALTLHFAYGAAAGATYGLLTPLPLLPASIQGALAGVALWVGSYLGWLPALRILPPATRHPRRRNLLMIAAHIVWGVTFGVINRKLNSEDQ